MKNILILFAVLALVSCKQADAPQTQTPVTTPVVTHVMNSLWQEVTVATVNAMSPASSIARDAASTTGFVDLQNSVNLYNATHVGDQWFVVNGTIPGIDQAPPCDIFIVDGVTHAVLLDADGNPFQHIGWPRAQLVGNYSGWLQDAQNAGGVLYIDVIPPAPDPPTADQVYAAHQVYVINNVGAIKYHYDCSVVPSGWPNYTPDTYYAFMVSTASLICRTDGVGQPDSPWSVVNGSVYTAP